MIAALILMATLRVPENWDTQKGRTIELHYEVLRAENPKSNEPIFILQGGPGQAATTLADFYARTYAAARKTHDIVLVDQRGTGQSNPLQCEPSELDILPDARKCRSALEKIADLTRYTTIDAVRDLERVRRRLGYERIHLYGTSYGTRVALVYAQTYPKRVRTLTLKGVVPLTLRIPNGFALDTERAITLTIDDCQADAACKAKYPNLRAEYAELKKTKDGRAAAVFRTLLQSTSSAADVPWLIHAGNDAIQAKVREVRAAAAKAVFSGMALSVICAEDAPHLDLERTDTFLGTYWIDQVKEKCALWPHRTLAPLQPKKLNIPTLLISGHLDSSTPPRHAEEAMRYLTNARHVVVRNGAHSFNGMAGCVDAIMSRFIETRDPRKLDDRCVDGIQRPEFR